MATHKTRTDREEPENGDRNERAPGSDARATLQESKKQYLIAARSGSALRAACLQPLSGVQMSGIVRQLPGVEIQRVISPRREFATFSASTAGTEEARDVYVVRMKSERAEALKQTLPPQIIFEEDAYLQLGRWSPTALCPIVETWKLTSALKPTRFPIQVLGAGDRPLRGAAVVLIGEGLPAQGTTDEKGQLMLDAPVVPGGRVRGLFVTAQNGHWNRYIEQPELSDDGMNVVRLQSLQETFPGFPDQYRFAWGARAMGLDKLDARLGGSGVKIAIIDSGVDCSHPLLKHIANGVDLTNKEDARSWREDTLGHGSLCAGTIAARGEGTSGFRGFAPDAEIHVFKLLPGGQCSALIDALDLCIQRKIDIVNLSLGSELPSLAVAQKLEDCAQNGVACIASAGSSGGRVQFPASSPHVLAVAAIGRLGEFPAGTWDAETVQEVDPREGFFSPTFSSSGPEVAVCAPGLAIVSTAPGGEYDAASGTSMAAAHVTGLAALLLAHHPLFAQHLTARGPQRVAALFQGIRSIGAPLALSAGRAGAGLPKLDLIAHQLIARPENGEVATRQAAVAAHAAQAVSPQPLMGTPPLMSAQSLANLAFAARSDAGPLAGLFAPQGISGPSSLGYVVPNPYFYSWFIPSHFQV